MSYLKLFLLFMSYLSYFMNVNKKSNLQEQQAVGLSKFSKTTTKRRGIYYNFQVITPPKIKALPSNFLVRKLSINR